MNKNVIIGTIIAAVAIAIVVGIMTTSNNTTVQNNTNNGVTQNIDTSQTVQSKLSGSVSIDGSSTVYPITEVIAEEFGDINSDVRVTVAVSGTGGGFKRFVTGETDINDSSRPITQKEKDAALANNVKWVEIPVALEGLTIVVHPDNNLVPNDCISIEELKEMWKPDRTITKWSDLNSAGSTQEIRLYGAGPDSGTFDYFTERVVGKARSSTIDYLPSEDDNILVQGVSNDPYALGYIPLAYVEEAHGKLKILKVSETKGSECFLPDGELVTNGIYPLARPLFIHVNYDQLQVKPELQKFTEFYIANAKMASDKVKYVPLADKYYTDALSMFKEKRYNVNDVNSFGKLIE